jgi:EpsI family protein
MLLVAFGGVQSGNAQLHRPEVCYPAAGFDLDGWQDLALPLSGRGVSARAVTASAPGRIEQILYWTRIGRDFPTSSLAQRWSILRHSLRGSLPDGTLVRISTIDPDRGRALKSLRTFAASLLQSGTPQLRELLVGKP